MTVEDFRNNILKIQKRFEEHKEDYDTEAQLRQSIITPVISLLGYDEQNPKEVDVEFGAHLVPHTKTPEKVDYAIKQDGEVIMLVEAKHWTVNLSDPKRELNQLQTYYSKLSKCKFGILTNGLIWKFYTDSLKDGKIHNNCLDYEPFFIFHLQHFTASDCTRFFQLFAKSNFNTDAVKEEARSMKMLTLFKQKIYKEIENPDAIVTLFKDEYQNCGIGALGKNNTALVVSTIKNTFKIIFDEKIQEDRRAIDEIRAQKEKDTMASQNQTPPEPTTFTKEEQEGLLIIRAIASEVIDPNRVQYRDYQGFCNINLDGVVIRNRVCELYFNDAKNLKLRVNGNIKDLPSVFDLYKHKEEILEVIKGLA